MRDLLVAAIIFGSLPFILWRPQIGVMMWVWISVMNPHRLTWGFAHAFNFAAIVAVVTLISVLISRDLTRPRISPLTVALFSFVAWVSVTTVFALHPTESFVMWSTFMKTQLMAILIPMLFHTKEDLRRLLWVLVLSIAYYGVKGGVWILLTGAGNRVWGPPSSYVEDNNAVAVAIVMMIPLMRYLQMTTPHRYVRYGLAVAMLLCGVAVLGTYSRGALLAVSAMMAFLWWRGRSKGILLLVAAVAIPFALSSMPEKWYDRMATIVDYQDEPSASGRLNTWGTMLNLAKDRPFVGGGFVVDTPEVYSRYSPDPTSPPKVAHSIYFQALGEHGFVGLALYLFLLAALWRSASRVIRIAKQQPHLAWAADLSLMMQVTLIGFAVGGAFLSLVNFDVPYYLMGIMAATLWLVERESRSLPAPSGAEEAAAAVPSRQPASN